MIEIKNQKDIKMIIMITEIIPDNISIENIYTQQLNNTVC